MPYSVRTTDMKKIGLLLGFRDIYDHGIARGVIRYARTRPDWELDGQGWMFRTLDAVGRWEGDGIITRVADEGFARRLKHTGVPVVDVAGAYTEYGFHRVTNDDRTSGRLVGEYFLSQGIHHFAVCGVSDVAWSHERAAGFAEILGLRVGDVPTFSRPLRWWERLNTPIVFDSFLRSLQSPTGLFATNDTIALNVLVSAGRSGLSVPQNLSVVGVDNDDITCELAQPTLSSVRLRLEELGYRAAEALARRLDDPADSEDMPVVAPGRLVERESSRLFATNDAVVLAALEIIHAEARLDISELADRLAVSRRSLEMRFRRETGTTPHKMITSVRLLRACELLRQSDATVAYVASEAGFQSVQRFYVVFRSHLGITPNQYRELDDASEAQLIIRLRKSE